jgi:hypothetical protein
VAGFVDRHLSPGPDVLENFAREFDRLDVAAERLRLYESIHNGERWSAPFRTGARMLMRNRM